MIFHVIDLVLKDDACRGCIIVMWPLGLVKCQPNSQLTHPHTPPHPSPHPTPPITPPHPTPPITPPPPHPTHHPTPPHHLPRTTTIPRTKWLPFRRCFFFFRYIFMDDFFKIKFVPRGTIHNNPSWCQAITRFTDMYLVLGGGELTVRGGKIFDLMILTSSCPSQFE